MLNGDDLTARSKYRQRAWLAFAVALACVAGAQPAAAKLRGRAIHYGGYTLTVPSSWPVYTLGSDSRVCIRFDRHAVYLGLAGSRELCPAHLVGRTEALWLEPLSGGHRGFPAPRASTLSRRRLAPQRWPYSATGEASFSVPRAGLLVTATWRDDPQLVKRILRGAELIGRPFASGRPTHRASRHHHRRAGLRAHAARVADPVFTGRGFDTCATPSQSTMSAWLSSPYRAVGVYIGGANMACAQPNLTSSWVSTELSAGWALVPIYVGLQAPANSCGCAGIDPANASAEGAAAASDAAASARAIGLHTGSAIYDDMEAYAPGSTNTAAVLSFLSSWTAQLHAEGYVAGVYSSSASGISDLVSRYGSGYTEPDDIWFANWNGVAGTSDPYVPAGDWASHQRLHQYQGGHDESYGGVALNIDNDYLDGAVASATGYRVPKLPGHRRH